MHPLCVLVILALLTVSCVSSGELNALSFRLWEQEQKQLRIEGQLAALDQELRRMLVELETPLRATQANLWAEMEGLRTQTATMLGQIEELQRSVPGNGGKEGAMADLARQVAYLDRSVTMIASQLALDLGPRPGVEERDAPPAPEPYSRVFRPEPAAEPTRAVVADDPARALYDGALQAFHARNYAPAQGMWDEFARTFPQHELVSNALFWQGESFFQMGDYAKAILAYQDVISKHPNSNKYAASMLKQGVSFFRLGKDRAGVLVLEDLVKRFPALPEAARAKALLDAQRKP